MLYFYIGIIRPVLEYAVAVWHTGLTADLSDQLELIQKRALVYYLVAPTLLTNRTNRSVINCTFHHYLLAEKTWLLGSSTHFLTQPAASITLSRKRGIILK